MSDHYDYTQTCSAALAAGTARTDHNATAAPSEGLPGPDGYVHAVTFTTDKQLAELDVLQRIMDGVARICAFHQWMEQKEHAENTESTESTAPGRLEPVSDGPACSRLRTLHDDSGDTYVGLVLSLDEYYWHQQMPELKVTVDLPWFRTRAGSGWFGALGGPRNWAEPVPARTALAQLLGHARQIGMGKNTGFPSVPNALSEDELSALRTAMNALADAHQHYFTYSDGYAKSYEGRTEIVVDPAAYLDPGSWAGRDRADDEAGNEAGNKAGSRSAVAAVHVASYLYGTSGRHADLGSIEELAAFAEQTHRGEFDEEYRPWGLDED